MNFTNVNLGPVLPESFLLIAVLSLLMLDLLLRDERCVAIHWLSVATLAGCGLFTVIDMQQGTASVFLFNNMFVGDAMSRLLKLVVYLSAATTLLYARDYLVARGMARVEFYSLALLAVLGMMVMISANHFMALYLGLELMSLSIYAMVAMQRDSSKATEAALKYFVLGALASGMLLFGMSMIYGATGSLEIPLIAQKIANGSANPVLNSIGLVFVVAGLAFKLGAVPFHMWVPDVYEGSPTAVTLFLGSAPKLAAFAFVIRMLAVSLAGLAPDWQQMLIILAVLSMGLGNLTAIAQTNVKRMLAYSAISHMGFMLLGIIAANANGFSSAMFYVVAYVFMTAGTFGLMMLLAGEKGEADGFDTYKGLNQRSPWKAFMLLLLMASMAGIPGTVGFLAKLSVIQAVMDIGLIWLAIVSVMFSLVGAFYYLRIIKLMYFDEPVQGVDVGGVAENRLLLSVNGLAILALGIAPQFLMNACAEAIRQSLHLA